MLERLEKFAELVEKEFSDLLREPPQIIGARLRLYLKDNSFIDIRYPLNNEYSFHWQRAEEILRINTAPNHKEIRTFPRHIHRGTRVEEDKVTDLNLEPEENLRRFLNLVRDELKR